MGKKKKPNAAVSGCHSSPSQRGSRSTRGGSRSDDRADGGSSSSQSRSDARVGCGRSSGKDSGSDSSDSTGRRKRGDEGGTHKRRVRNKSDSDESSPPRIPTPTDPDPEHAAPSEDTADTAHSAPPTAPLLLPDLMGAGFAQKNEASRSTTMPPLDLIGSGLGSGSAQKREDSQIPQASCHITSEEGCSGAKGDAHQRSTADHLFDDEESLKTEFKTFLKTFVVPGQTGHYYPLELHATLSKGGNAKFRIHFDHLLLHNKDFAIKLCQRRYLCFPWIQEFIRDAGYPVELRRSDVDLYRFPRSIVTLEDLLYDKSKLVTLIKNVLGMQNVSVWVLKDLTIALISGFLHEIRHKHKMRLAWNGCYHPRQMVVINGCEFRIMTKPKDYEAPDPDAFITQNSDPFTDACKQDLIAIEEIFTPKVRVVVNGAEDFPVLYASLRSDLQSVIISEVKNDAFWDYLLNHPVLKHPIVRHNLVCNMHLSDECDLFEYHVKMASEKTE